jgi:hypothetical protein
VCNFEDLASSGSEPPSTGEAGGVMPCEKLDRAELTAESLSLSSERFIRESKTDLEDELFLLLLCLQSISKLRSELGVINPSLGLNGDMILSAAGLQLLVYRQLTGGRESGLLIAGNFRLMAGEYLDEVLEEI